MRQHVTNILSSAFCVLVVLALQQPSFGRAAEPARPNVIFFLVDDLGWRDVGCYGSSFYETPNIDRFAKEGVRFTQAYAACHVCSSDSIGHECSRRSVVESDVFLNSATLFK